MGPSDQARTVPWLVAAPLLLALVATAYYYVWGVATGWQASTYADIAYNATFILAGIAGLARSLISPSVRWAWLAFGLGLIAWGLGDIYWTVVLGELQKVPYPSPADIGYLIAPLAFFVGIPLLIRNHVGRFTPASLLDAAIGVLAVTAVGTAVLAPALVGLDRGDSAAVITNLAYPLFDLALLAMIAGTLVLGRPREARSLYLVGFGLLIWAAADVNFLFLEAKSAYVTGWLDTTWQLGAIAIAAGALIRPTGAPASRERSDRTTLLLPALFTLMAVAVLVWDHYERLRGISVALAAATLLAVGVRLLLSSRENDELMRELQVDAVTDALTGLGNRRSLFSDLDDALADSRRDRSGYVFALFDLDGFKTYNDSFGHPAGDALLRRLGENLSQSVEPSGKAYRLGGDEFCVLVALGSRRRASIFEAARGALQEEGEGFVIGASGGWIVISPGSTTAEEALRDADRRMYEEKASRSPSSKQQTQDVLMRIFHEREPSLGDHSEGVARLCMDLGRRLSLDAEAKDILVRAAELHDVGKIAIPDEILHKPGPLNDAEWELMRRHTLIGDRILGATPALRPVARLVRSSHERWDGDGYPDGLAGDEIPLGARIICICDTFDAMPSERSYKDAVSAEEALAELRRCAGAQFDPELVDAFCRLIEEGPANPDPLADEIATYTT